MVHGSSFDRCPLTSLLNPPISVRHVSEALTTILLEQALIVLTLSLVHILPKTLFHRPDSAPTLGFGVETLGGA